MTDRLILGDALSLVAHVASEPDLGEGHLPLRRLLASDDQRLLDALVVACDKAVVDLSEESEIQSFADMMEDLHESLRQSAEYCNPDSVRSPRVWRDSQVAACVIHARVKGDTHLAGRLFQALPDLNRKLAAFEALLHGTLTLLAKRSSTTPQEAARQLAHEIAKVAEAHGYIHRDGA